MSRLVYKGYRRDLTSMIYEVMIGFGLGPVDTYPYSYLSPKFFKL